MRLFVSWSGSVSHSVALTLRTWLPSVIQAIDPFVSSKDIEKGERWGVALTRELEACSEGIVVVTAENKDRPWLNFEAGALAKQSEISRVRTLLFGVSNADLTGPLTSFQSTNLADRDDVFKLVHDLAQNVSPRLTESRVQTALERWWPDLQTGLSVIEPPQQQVRSRPDGEILEELLVNVRDLDRRLGDLARQQTNQIDDRLSKIERGLLSSVERALQTIEYRQAVSRSEELATGKHSPVTERQPLPEFDAEDIVDNDRHESEHSAGSPNWAPPLESSSGRASWRERLGLGAPTLSDLAAQHGVEFQVVKDIADELGIEGTELDATQRVILRRRLDDIFPVVRPN